VVCAFGFIYHTYKTSKNQKKRIEFPIGDSVNTKKIYAEVVTHVAGSLEAGRLPRNPESLFVEINIMKS
jgi:hypothetical protein